jgi:hypothetical protein
MTARSAIAATLALCVCACARTSGCASSPAHSPAPDQLAAIAPPAGQALRLTAQAKGAQVYTCKAKTEGGQDFEWSLTAPRAELFDEGGGKIGTHFAGPTWQLADGSKVVGAVKQKVAAPDSIPWLLLEAKSAEGAGKLQGVAFIQRLDTVGGQPPSAPCDAGRTGTQESIPYTATYRFYSPQ